MNACGHHHIGISASSSSTKRQRVVPDHPRRRAGKNSALGKVIGPSFSAAEVPQVIERIIGTFVLIARVKMFCS